MRTLCNAYKKDENLAKKEVREVNIKLQETENKFKEILEERCREYEDRIAELNHQLLLGKRE